jgi:hypothetical protein
MDSDHGALDMNMAVNEPGRQYQALQVNGIAGATAIEACDPAFMDGHVRSMHLAGEKVGNVSSCEEEIDLHFTPGGSDHLFEIIHAKRLQLVVFKWIRNAVVGLESAADFFPFGLIQIISSGMISQLNIMFSCQKY